MDTLREIEKAIMPVDREINFQIGDTVKVHYKIIEGNRERIQVFEGIVIAIDGKGMSKTFTVRKLSFDIGVERIFPLYSTRISNIEVVRSGKARRAKLYFLRDRKGKSAKLREKGGKASKKHTVTAEDVPVTGSAEDSAAETAPEQES